MKDYSESIAYMRQRKQEQTESHQTPYSDSIEAMELCQLQELKRKRRIFILSALWKRIHIQNPGGIYSRRALVQCMRSVYGVGERR